jgi:hypothetical protein
MGECLLESISTESDVRFKFIDRILVEVLSWPRENLDTEDNADVGRIDWIPVVNSANRAEVEAKSDSIAFGTHSRHAGEAYKLSGPAISVAARQALSQ